MSVRNQCIFPRSGNYQSSQGASLMSLCLFSLTHKASPCSAKNTLPCLRTLTRIDAITPHFNTATDVHTVTYRQAIIPAWVYSWSLGLRMQCGVSWILSNSIHTRSWLLGRVNWSEKNVTMLLLPYKTAWIYLCRIPVLSNEVGAFYVLCRLSEVTQECTES